MLLTEFLLKVFKTVGQTDTETAKSSSVGRFMQIATALKGTMYKYYYLSKIKPITKKKNEDRE